MAILLVYHVGTVRPLFNPHVMTYHGLVLSVLYIQTAVGRGYGTVW